MQPFTCKVSFYRRIKWLPFLCLRDEGGRKYGGLVIIVFHMFEIRQVCLIPLQANQCMLGGLYVYFLYHKKYLRNTRTCATATCNFASITQISVTIHIFYKLLSYVMYNLQIMHLVTSTNNGYVYFYFKSLKTMTI